MLRSTVIDHVFCLSTAVLTLACASPKVEPEPNQSTLASAAPSTPTSSALAASAPPSTVPSTVPSAAPADTLDPEAIERENDGCKFRKSTNKLSACAKQGKNLGAWVPTEAEFAEVATLSRGACYCVTGLDALAKSCMQRVRSPLVTFTVGTLGDPTDCTVTIASAESQTRRFLRVHAANRDVSTFYSTLFIYEKKAAAFASYFVGFKSINEADIASGEEGVSVDMKREWQVLPEDLRKWMTTD